MNRKFIELLFFNKLTMQFYRYFIFENNLNNLINKNINKIIHVKSAITEFEVQYSIFKNSFIQLKNQF